MGCVSVGGRPYAYYGPSWAIRRRSRRLTHCFNERRTACEGDPDEER
jgi:hypothetical protein